MPDFTPPWERMPLYITSFQSSPVRIFKKKKTIINNDMVFNVVYIIYLSSILMQRKSLT